jgi:hypothetical protein
MSSDAGAGGGGGEGGPGPAINNADDAVGVEVAHELRRALPALERTLIEAASSPLLATMRGGGESFLRVHWVAVPKALRARRVNRRRRRSPGG